jgi:hypothetical protein
MSLGGKVLNGLKWHSNGEHLIYPLGSTVVIKSVVDGSLIFLTGHSNVITTLALSKCGRYVASGQRTEMGQKVSYYIVKDVHKVNFISELFLTLVILVSFHHSFFTI